MKRENRESIAWCGTDCDPKWIQTKPKILGGCKEEEQVCDVYRACNATTAADIDSDDEPVLSKYSPQKRELSVEHKVVHNKRAEEWRPRSPDDCRTSQSSCYTLNIRE